MPSRPGPESRVDSSASVIGGYVEPSAVAFGILNSDPAVITMDVSGKVQVRLGTGSHGHSIETTIAQVVATHLGLQHRRRRDHPG